MNNSLNNKTELVFILDKSGSMANLADDARDGFNALLTQNKTIATPGNVFVTTILFNNQYDVVNNREDIFDVAPLTKDEYLTCGTTALYDAIGKTIAYLDGMHRELAKDDIPAKTMIFITTDGYENASRLYGGADVKKLISRKTEEGWKFVFLAAGIDAEAQAETIGLDKKFSARFDRTDRGVRSMNRRMTCLSKAIVMRDYLEDDEDESIVKILQDDSDDE